MPDQKGERSVEEMDGSVEIMGRGIARAGEAYATRAGQAPPLQRYLFYTIFKYDRGIPLQLP